VSVTAEARVTRDSPIARRRARPPEWLWPLSIAFQVASAAALTAYTYFFVDDWLFIAEARRIPFGLPYLRMGLFEHFSPISRLLDKLLVHDSTGSFALAHSLQLLMYAAAIAAFAFAVRTILGNRWSAFALTIAFGQSLFLMRLLNWWTATANILPATIFGLVAFGAYLRWQRERSWGWLIVCVGCFFGSLLDYETAMLLPFYLAAVRFLILDGDLHPGAWLRVLRSEWLIWACFVVLDLGAAINYYTTYYIAIPHPTVVKLLDFLVTAVFGTFIPALFGIKNPESAPGRELAVIVACVMVLLALTAYLVHKRPRAWRCVLAFAFIALITLLPLGLARVTTGGVHVGKELYYQQPLQYMFLLLFALALRCEPRRAPPRWLAAIRVRLRAALPAVVVAGVAAYGALYVTSVDAMANASWEPHRSRAYVRAFQASVLDAVRRTGREPVLFNLTVPPDIDGFAPFNSYAVFFPMIDSHVRFSAVAAPMYVVSESGALVALGFTAADTGTLSRATIWQRERPPEPARLRGGFACMPPGSQSAVLRVPLRRAVRLGVLAGQLPHALRVLLRTPVAASVTVLAQGMGTLVGDGGFSPNFRRGTSAQYVPLYLDTDANAIELQLPSGACVGSLAVGSFALVAP
jgi:hypothetical protein